MGKKNVAPVTEGASPDAAGVLIEQAQALSFAAQALGAEVDEAVEAILACRGRVVISGMGKSGIVGRKIAATFASTGTRSFFVHPGDACRGDLGMIAPEDLVLLGAFSGETDEVIRLLPSLKRFGNKIIALVGNEHSTLARHSDIVLLTPIEREACPNNLAPTTSTTVTMVSRRATSPPPPLHDGSTRERAASARSNSPNTIPGAAWAGGC